MSEDPLTNPEEIWYTDGSSFVLDGKRRGGYAGVSNFETIEAKPLPPGTSAQLAELIALTRVLGLEKGKRVATYTDSKYAFLVLHEHAAIWKERGHLITIFDWGPSGGQVAPFFPNSRMCMYHQKGILGVSVNGYSFSFSQL